jgi:MoaA/NifB/PqqE/SkfB family radical SAM enzyme
VFETIVNHAQQNPNKTFIISPIASGEIFASHSGLAFLESLKSYPHNNIKLVITSNGTLFMKNRDLMESLRRHIWRITVSIDAATPETYAQVRGGNWEELQQGLRLFQKKLTSISFVVQERNYHEIEPFAALGLELGTRVFYHKFHNWGHWSPEWWKENNVIDRTKPNFQTAINSLIRVRRTYGDRIGLTGDLENYITKALT